MTANTWLAKLSAVILASLFLGCAAQEIELSAAEYLSLGRDYMKEDDYRRAIPAFESAVLSSNTPEDARLAQFELSNAFFLRAENSWFTDEEGYLNAIAAYETYYDLYPNDRNERLVLYRLAYSYSLLSFPPRNDQSFTRSSLKYLNEYKRKFPRDNGEKNYEGVDSLLKRMTDKLAEHEYEVAKFYMRVKKAESAVQRLLYLLRSYPGSSFEQSALVMLTEITYKTPKLKSASKSYFDELSARFPDNEEIPILKKRYGW
ncbi:MAG: outer membrane protein assembly factor BamD [Deferribacteraceae bacterium]|jgi:outer membrane protein assembly factor BamD|nr:outer membrane protein assembly factor BamD [Deferribacteraceae bacterium]